VGCESSVGGVDGVRGTVREILKALHRAVIGLREETKLIMVSMLANGHVLLEGVPGVAKTTIVKGLARLLGLYGVEVEINGVPFRGLSRIQFTPDLLPSDITGSLVYNPATRSFEVRFGPIFAYMVLADEINRAIPRTQSALLQAMQEKQVTIGNETYSLEYRDRGKFFLVFATQNPVEQEGTYPLPEAQLDRFLMRIIVGYPESLEEEKNILKLHAERLTEPIEDLEPIVEPGWLVEAQEAVAKCVEAGEEALDYIVRIIRSTRPELFEPVGEYLELGASPRAGIALLRAAKAHAAVRGSNIVEREDVDSVLFPVLNHRLIPRMEKLVEYEEKTRYGAQLALIKDALNLIRKTVA
jgi:MoxR-like ATPase